MKILLGILIGLLVSVSAQSKLYKIDALHSAVMFKAHHFGAGYTWGQFTGVSGNFNVDEKDLKKSSVNFSVKGSSIVTHDKKRDDHLKGPDFLNVKEFPMITFKSKSIAKAKGGFNVTGDLMLNGVKKEIIVMAKKTGVGNDPWGNERYGFDIEHNVSLKGFSIKGIPGGVGDSIKLYISLEGMRKIKK